MKLVDQYGYYAVHYSLGAVDRISLPELKERLLTEKVKHTGWPPFWFPTREGIQPKVVDEETYECVHDGSGATEHVEKWTASTAGEFVILRAHDLDYEYPGEYISLTLPVWRIGEIVLHSGRMGSFFGAEAVDFTTQFTGLKGRSLSTKKVETRYLGRGHQTHAEEFRKSISMKIDDIDRQAALFTEKLLTPFYHLFEFEPSPEFFESEIEHLRASRF